MARHFSVNKSGAASRGWQHFTALDWLHFAGRTLFCLFFLHALMWNLSHIDEATAQLTAAGWLPADLVVPAIVAGIAVCFIGSACFFIAADPLSFGLLLAFLVPQTVAEHLLPLLQLDPSSKAFHAHLTAALQSLAMLGALLVVWTYTQHIAWLEGEQKAEIRRAMEAWYDKKEHEAAGGTGGGGSKAAEAEHKKEPKKVK